MSSFIQPPSRGATTLGEYAPNHFLLRFRVAAPFLVQAANGVATHDDDWVSVFWHEYIHYWHNVSTLTGLKSLEYTQHVLACVSRGIADRGSDLAAPNIALDPADEGHLRGLSTLFAHVEGSAGPSGADEGARIVRVLRASHRREEVPLRDGPAPDPTLELEVEYVDSAGNKKTGTMLLGSLAIEESAAILAQDSIEQTQGLMRAPFAPEFPYRVAERLVEAVLGAPPTPEECFALCTLALMFPHPGPAFQDILETARKIRRRDSLSTIPIAEIAELYRQKVLEWQGTMVARALPDLRSMHVGRGMVTDAINLYADTFELAAKLRESDLLFDARRFFRTDKVAVVREQLQQFPAPDMQQERCGVELPRDLLVGVDSRGSPFRALQAQQHFAALHAGRALGHARSTRCPFFHACGLDERRSNPERCEQRPWEWAGDHSEGRTCWYGLGASAVVGKLTYTMPDEGMAK